MHRSFTSQSKPGRACEVSSSLATHTQPCFRLPTEGLRVLRRARAPARAHARATGPTQQAQERASSHSYASTSAATTSEPVLTRKQSQESVADKLIDLFATKSPGEWRKLIAFSKQWSSLADRCDVCYVGTSSALCASCSGMYCIDPLIAVHQAANFCKKHEGERGPSQTS